MYLLPLFLSINICHALELKIAIIDTGFCDEHPTQKNIVIEKSYDATGTIHKTECPKNYLELPRYHGENVLKTFVDQLDKTKSVRIYPIIVFNNLGIQDLSYWNKAIAHLNTLQPDLIISAVGLKTKKNEVLTPTVKSLWFLSAPRVSPYIKNTDTIFPQNNYNLKNVFLFGSYSALDYVDGGQFYLENIRLFQKDQEAKFSGSSYATPKITAQLINLCSRFLLEDINSCIKNNSYIVKDKLKNIDMQVLK